MNHVFLAATAALVIGTTAPIAHADVDVRIVLGAPGIYYVPGHGAVLRFGVHPRRHHPHRSFRGHRGAKKHHGHVPARPYYWRHGHDHRRYYRLKHGFRHEFHHRHDPRRYGLRDDRGHRHYRRESRTRIYVY